MGIGYRKWSLVRNTKHLLPTDIKLWNEDFTQKPKRYSWTKQPSSMEYIEWDLLEPLNEYDYGDTAEEDTGLYSQYVPHSPPSEHLPELLHSDIGVISRTTGGQVVLVAPHLKTSGTGW